MTKPFTYRFVCVAVGLCFLLATSAVYHALLPPLIPEGVVEKLQFFTQHKDEFDTLFLGSSRFYYSVSPQIFDNVTRENGIPTRTFNFGVDGMNPPENFYVLEQILKTEPRGLKRIFVEVADIETKSHANILSTQRLLYWHDWPRTALTLRKAFDPDGTAKWYKKLNRLWSARRIFTLHLSLFEKQFTNVGRAEDFLSGQTEIPASRVSFLLGPNGDGYRLAGKAMSPERAENFQRKLAREIAAARPEFIDPYAERAYRECAAQIRRLGAEPVFVVPPGFYQSPISFRESPPPGLLLSFNDAKAYPQLYDTKVRVDEQHLTNEGSTEFTRLLALELVRSLRITLTAMLFVEFRFFWFFLAVFCVYWSLRENRSRKIWLLACSYVFYAAWNWKFLFLLMGSSLLDYIVGMGLARTEDPRVRRAWLTLSLVANLGTIAFFKYYNFFVTSAAELMAWLGLPASAHTLNIIIPVGVSFYTFHSMSYTIDVYRRRMRAVPSLVDVLCFIGFFPQMVAGPIVRAKSFLPQLQSLRNFSNVNVRGALVLFLTGFIKKACIADGVAGSVDRYFAAPWNFDTMSAWIAVLFYAVQIYCDFSGYTDMAIACARLLGYELTINFRFPYFSRDIAEFWQRWHISLSTWLRDYLFQSLGGARGTHWFAYRNIMITMVLGGLWHGAAWTFVIFGALHGVALVVHHEWKRLVRKIHAPRGNMWWIACPLTFYWVCITITFFRAGDVNRAWIALRSFVLFGSNGLEQLGAWKLWIFFALAFLHWLNFRGTFAHWWRRGPDPVFAAAYGCAAATVLLFIPQHYTPFIYFQF